MRHRALTNVATRVDRARAGAILARHGIDAHAVAQQLASHARVTMNFHPDRLRPDGLTVAEGLLADGHYRSQFDTRVTNGSPTAFRGGSRDGWERALFGDAYRDETERPKYGAFNVRAHADGGSPRFGSCFFVLRPEVIARCTFTWGDSNVGPEHFGTIEAFDAVLAAWLEGAPGGVRESVHAPATGGVGRALDAYIEAQIHGPIALAGDVEALVVDPAFVGDGTLQSLAERYGFALHTHPGFVLSAAEIDDEFRGPRMRPLATRIAGGEDFDAGDVGRAAAELARNPAAWADWGPPDEAWQHLKQLWHCLVRFGRPAISRRRSR